MRADPQRCTLHKFFEPEWPAEFLNGSHIKTNEVRSRRSSFPAICNVGNGVVIVTPENYKGGPSAMIKSRNRFGNS